MEIYKKLENFSTADAEDIQYEGNFLRTPVIKKVYIKAKKINL